ncbi:MAG: insulinase family protein [Deltaproteobacteria bacterium]|nr:insulinase family protein [Deltaproteobacteria bacterium]
MAQPTFILQGEHAVEALNVKVQSFVHRVTGAEHYHLLADNPENVFMVGFRTAPTDSTGVAHILEHTVLCGSQRYPVRDPFFMMLRRSLNTFMNAFTSSDWTAYPFASQNRKDYFNLLDVYLDAVFFPRLDELDFAQEGHRLEFSDPTDSSSPLIFKGVVYNEMQGAMTTPASFLWQGLTQHLFPTATYRFNSGGDPEIIPLLSHAQLKAFHQRNYHPSNAFFLTYGDLPAAQLQAIFEERALKNFSREAGAPFFVSPEKRFKAPKIACERFPAESVKEGESDDRSHVLMGWLLDAGSSLENLIEAHLLAAVLLDNSSSPLLDVLETTALGRAPSPLCGLDDDHKELIFCCGLEGCAADAGAEVEDLILATLQQVAAEGVPLEQVEAALHQLELQRREIGGDGYPYGLQLLLQAFPAVVHNSSVIERLDIDPVLIKLREKIKDSGYIGALLQRLLLDNPHRVRLSMVPDSELAGRREKALRARLAARLRALDSRQKEALLLQAKALAARQQENDDPEILPRVGLEDVPDKLPIPEGKPGPAPLPLTCYAAGTNGLVYQQVVFALPALDESAELSDKDNSLLDLLPDYSSCLTELGCNGLDYRQTQAWQARVCGGLNAYYKVRGALDDSGRVKGLFVLSGKALCRNYAALNDLMRKTLESIRFDEVEHICEIMAQTLAHQEQQVTASGHQLVMRAAAAGCGPIAALGHRVHGLEGLKKLKKFYAEISQKGEALQSVSRRFAALHERIIAAPLQFLLVAEEEREASLTAELEQVWQGSQFKPAPDFQDFSLPLATRLVREAWTTDTKVNFCAKAYATVPVAHPDAAPLAVLGGFLRNGYLHRAIREEGGAYGGGAGHDPVAAAFRFYSYRDPRLKATLEDFDRSLVWLQEAKHEARQVEEAILGVVSQIDKPGSPAGRAKQAFFDGLYGRDPEFLRAYRRRVLAVTLKDLQRVAHTYLNPQNAGIAVLTSPARAASEAAALGLEVLDL